MARRPTFSLRWLLFAVLLVAAFYGGQASLLRELARERQLNEALRAEQHELDAASRQGHEASQRLPDTDVARSQEVQAKVTFVPDGDSLVVVVDGREERVRLLGIDAPEKGQPFANRSRELTRSLCAAKTITLVPHERDKYGRILAEAFVGGVNVGHQLVTAGLAWSYHEEDAGLEAIESDARAARRGLWSQPDPVPPWQWRQSH
jgi:endonuclease YncB( thermonuclease family)